MIMQHRDEYERLGRRIRELTPPADFRVTALMTCFNEADVLADVVAELVTQGVSVYVIDNWSDDDSFAIAKGLEGHGVVGLERFPATGPTRTYDWARLLGRVTEVARTSSSDWWLHHDADEVRESPWPDITLRQALHGVGELGYNAIDHTMLNFAPTDDTWKRGDSLRRHFSHFEFGSRPGHFLRINGWRRGDHTVDLASSGGHDVQFPERRVFPYKFLLRHYPIRSQAQGERKVFRERQARWNAEERARGWHVHYDELKPGVSFVRRPEDLVAFDAAFYERYFNERLGIAR